MRLNNYIINENRSKPIKPVDAVDIIKSKCSNIYKYYQKGLTAIYRGISGQTMPALFVDPSKGDLRVSANTTNYYTLLMDNLPSWKQYPKRSRSLICSTDIFNASSYGMDYMVFPYNGTKIGIVNSEDIWNTFKNLYLGANDLTMFNDILENILNVANFNIGIGNSYDTSWNVLLKVIKNADKKKDIVLQSIEEEIVELSTYKIYKEKKWIYKWLHSDKSLVEVLNDEMDPSMHAFKLVKAGNGLPYDRELWVGGPCVLIRPDMSNQFADIDYDGIRAVLASKR